MKLTLKSRTDANLNPSQNGLTIAQRLNRAKGLQDVIFLITLRPERFTPEVVEKAKEAGRNRRAAK